MQILTKARTGVRNEILLGYFMMKFIGGNEEEVTPLSVNLTSKGDKNINFAPPDKVEIEPEPVEIDLAFKEEILNIVHDKNFLIYCGLFNSKPYKRQNNLLISLESPYNYEVLKQPVNSSALYEIFNDYEKIILRHNGVEYLCPKFNDAVKETKILKAETVEEVKEDEKNYSGFNVFIKQLSNAGFLPELILRKRNETQEEFDESTLTDLEAEHEKENE